MNELHEKIKNIADKEGWSVDITDNGDDCYTFTFQKFSPYGQDFSFDVDLEDNNIETLIDGIHQYYFDFDVSYETYLWLDNEGHGKNGAPYDMKDIYEDMEDRAKMIRDLYNTFRQNNW